MLLKQRNRLRDILQYASEYYTLELFHLRDIDDMIHVLNTEFKFVPPVDEEGRTQYWANYVLAELDDEQL
jgi:muconolactone delta-isomerase